MNLTFLNKYRPTLNLSYWQGIQLLMLTFFLLAISIWLLKFERITQTMALSRKLAVPTASWVNLPEAEPRSIWPEPILIHRNQLDAYSSAR